MEYENIWISSEEHLTTLMAVFNKASTFQKLVGAFDLPDGFPRLGMFWGLLSSSRSPLAYFGHGTLTVDGDHCSFRSTKPHAPGNRIDNVDRSLNFELDRNALQSITRFQSPSAYSKYFSIPFVEINTAQDLLNGRFLLCKGSFRMGGIRKQTDLLFKDLQQWQVLDGAEA